MDSVHQGDINGRFIIAGKGQTIYKTSGSEYFLVDTIKKKLVDYPFYEFGNSFSVKNNYISNGSILKYNDTEIGRIKPSRNVVGNGIIAIEKGENIIEVWSDITKAWTTTKIPWINGLIGWVDEE